MPVETPHNDLLKFRLNFSESNLAEMHMVLDESIRKALRGFLNLRIAKVCNTFEKHPLMHYHFTPEIFIQLQGTTEFILPKERLVVKPGDVCILPSGVPHRESIYKEQGAFRNMVIAFYRNTVSVHFACEASPGKPDIEVIEFFYAPNILQLEDLANTLIQSFHSITPARDTAIRGLSTAFFSFIRNLVDTGNEDFNSETGKIFQVKWLVREQLSNPELSVKSIATKLSCSADYLSHLFHQSTGEKLIPYIQRKRIESAKLALETTPLYISEIAWSSGFADPAYFARIFKRFTGKTPQAYREHLDEKRRKQEETPKTVYTDRDVFSMGHPIRKRRKMLLF
ncbi:MAG: AraC family transcriptional regulator [Opitutales bacterium]|nr:AraC family transcriptional regulator [Opitutales bacterium]